jgi:hypothetical protein
LAKITVTFLTKKLLAATDQATDSWTHIWLNIHLCVLNWTELWIFASELWKFSSWYETTTAWYANSVVPLVSISFTTSVANYKSFWICFKSNLSNFNKVFLKNIY